MKNKLTKHYLIEIKKCIRDLKTKGKRYKQIPNLFTASRIISPIFIVPAILSGNMLLATIFATGFALTDYADGYFARKFDVVTQFGRDLDGFSDKVFAIGIMLPLLILQPLLIYPLLLEGAISGINLKSKLKANNPVTSMLGKVKSGVLSALLVATVLPKTISLTNDLIPTWLATHLPTAINISPNIFPVLFGSTIILQTLTTVQYAKKYRNKEKEKREKENNLEITNKEPDNNSISVERSNQIIKLNNLRTELTCPKTIASEDEPAKGLKLKR